MAWTAPRTWVVGELVTEVLLNTHVRDNLRLLKGTDGQIDFDDDVIIDVDDQLFRIGVDGDVVLGHRSTALLANTALTNVLIGTPVSPALAANSLIISNVTASGDILIAGNLGGNSRAYFFADVSADTLDLYTAGVSRIALSAAGVITISGDEVISDGSGLILGNTAQVASIGGIGTTPEMQELGTGDSDAAFVVGRFSADTSPPRFQFLKSRGATLGTKTATADGDILGEVQFVGITSGGSSGFDGGMIRATQDGAATVGETPTRFGIFTSPGNAAIVERIRITSAGLFLVNDTANANMAIGVTLNQGGNSNHILSGKASAVATGLTTAPIGQDVETDDYFTFSKFDSLAGGLELKVLMENAALTSAFRLEVYGGQAGTAKTTGAEALVNIEAFQHDGANALSNIATNGNVFSVRSQTAGARATRFMVDAEGDLFAVNVTITALDEYDDIKLVRAFDLARTAQGIIRSRWDAYVQYTEADLVAAGILGASRAAGGLWNITQHMRLFNGAIWQLGTVSMAHEERLSLVEQQVSEIANQVWPVDAVERLEHLERENKILHQELAVLRGGM